MITGAQPMACGNCGLGLFRMFSTGQEYQGMRLIAECFACGSTSVISTRPAELEIEFGEGSDGRLCHMNPKA